MNDKQYQLVIVNVLLVCYCNMTPIKGGFNSQTFQDYIKYINPSKTRSLDYENYLIIWSIANNKNSLSLLTFGVLDSVNVADDAFDKVFNNFMSLYHLGMLWEGVTKHFEIKLGNIDVKIPIVLKLDSVIKWIWNVLYVTNLVSIVWPINPEFLQKLKLEMISICDSSY